MDSRKKKILTVLCVGLVILCWRIYAEITKYSPTDQAEAESSVTAVDFGQVVSDPREDEGIGRMLKRQAAVTDEPWGRDPFADISSAYVTPEAESAQPAHNESRPPPEPPSLKLGGVSGSDGQWLAMVDGELARTGDLIRGEFKVIEITKQSVTIESGGWAIRYEMGSAEPVVRSLSEAP